MEEHKVVAVDNQKSDRILSEVLKRENRIGKVEIEEEKTEIVIFSLGKAYYAFYGENVKEILPYEKRLIVDSCEIWLLSRL